MQLELFDMLRPLPRQPQIERIAVIGSSWQDVICWTKMHAEAGQELQDVVSRKEMERRAGQGTFFWGIGSPLGPPRAYLGTQTTIPLVFSKMLSRPKAADRNPNSIIVWQRYFDAAGRIRQLPHHVLITSRADTPTRMKSRHYALVCLSHAPLELRSERAFDPSAYRNASKTAGAVGYSQITALLRQVVAENSSSKYNIDMRAELIEPYWVRLTDPARMRPEHREILRSLRCETVADWITTVSLIRSNAMEIAPSNRSPALFA